ncbi:hypothetical protein HPULCUR_007864 [Helicostylum pulchrum]|uniref:Uncharacterized protein n=1 Tax=Helicostylum pulchrum TaxID=562976 RepID=A0ABP9Y602_9FUNG
MMTPMESLLNAIDNAHPIHLPFPTKRSRQSSPQQSMSIESMLDNERPLKRYCAPMSPPPQSPTLYNSNKPTIVTCYHASVAQKSYGSEKRFLCPPPIVMMSDSNQSPLVSMSVVCETNNDNRQLEQRTLLDENLRGSFKYLFVTGTAKAKQFCLRVNLQQQQQQPYVSFFSNPISIISKPSKKTAKARNISTCLFTNSFVSLFNRINSQTVRTKYLTSENKQLCAKHSSWSPFEIIVVRQPNQAVNPDNHSVSVPITYGTEIILKDVNTGVSSPPLIIRKIDKGHVVHGAYGLLSQMQKIALQLSSTINSKPLYLNANGTAMNIQESPTIEGNMNHNTSAWIDFTESRTTVTNDIKFESVDDYLCWTIVGISKFEYAYSEQQVQVQPVPTLKQLSPPPSPPRSIIPFPVISSVEYDSQQHSLKVVGQHLMQSSRLLEFWLGNHGPLYTTVENNVLTMRLPDTQELIVASHDMLITRPNGARYFELPLLLVRQQDGFIYHSTKTLCYDIDLDCEYGKWSVNNESSSGSSISSTCSSL